MTATPTSFDLTYRLSEDAFMQACNSLWAYRAIGARGNQIVALLLAALGLLLIWQGVPGWWGWLLVAGAAVIWAMNLSRDRIWRRDHRDSPKFAGDIQARFTPDQITVHSCEGKNNLPWSHFHTFARTDRAFFLIVDQRQFSIIPLAAFTDSFTANQFEALLTQKLKRLPRRYF